jgi:two-component system response regulator CpxR
MSATIAEFNHLAHDDLTMEAEILIIDDDRELGEMLREFLAPDHFHLTACTTGEDGLIALQRDRYDLLILDVMLPGINGIDVLKQVRQRNDLPVIMLTARGDDVDRILGLEFGADDYLSKPFNPRELLARIKAILRRAGPAPASKERQQVGDLTVDLRSRQVIAGAETLQLTGTEFELLHCLLRSPGEVVTRDVLSREALGRGLLPYDRSIDTHISNLRRKLENAGVSSPRILNQRGIGYRMLVDAEGSD